MNRTKTHTVDSKAEVNGFKEIGKGWDYEVVVDGEIVYCGWARTWAGAKQKGEDRIRQFRSK